MTFQDDVDLLKELDDNGEQLSSWEIEFVESMTKQLRLGRGLSVAQRGKLEQIAEERVR